MKKLSFLLCLVLFGLGAAGQSCAVNWGSYIYADTSIHAFSSTTGTDTNSVYDWYVISQANDTVYQHSSETNYIVTPRLAPGVYSICLAVNNGGSLCGYACKNNADTITGPLADSCQGLSAYWLPTHQSGDTVDFLAVDTAANDHRYWYYGDGTNSYTICGCHPVDPAHVYPGPGTYQACLYVYRPGYNCGEDSFCRTITITGSTADSCQGLTAYWYSTYQSGDTVDFLAVDTAANDHRYWYYGDGTNSYTICGCHPVDPVHVYPGPGTYQACLYDYRPGVDCGTDSFCRTIVITGPADSCQGLSAYWYPTHQSGDTVGFLATDTFTNDHRYWYYGDGTNSYTICSCHPVDPSHVYPGPGTYQACLIVYRPGANCGVDSFCRTITIIGPADSCAGFNTNWSVAHQSGDTVQFLASDISANDHRYWVFGDGTNSYQFCGCHPIDPVHVFPGPGTYEVCLYNYRLGVGCGYDSTCRTIVIAPQDTNPACANLSLSWNYDISGDTLNFHFCFYSATSNCNDSLCQDISIISTLILHLDEIAGGNNDIQLFPNPFTQYTTIHINETTPPPFSLNIYDADGNEVRQQIMNANQFNVERDGLASGVYLFQILKGEQVIGKGRMIAK